MKRNLVKLFLTKLKKKIFEEEANWKKWGLRLKGASLFNLSNLHYTSEFSTLKKLFFRGKIFLIAIYYYLQKQLNRTFNLIDSTNLYRKFSFQTSFFSKFERVMLRLVVGDDSELSRTVYTHTRRVIFPLPLRVLQSPATRKRSWPSSRETLRIASPLVLLWIHAVEESKKLVLPSRELAYSRFLTRNLFVPSKNREKIVDNDESASYEGDVSSSSISRVNPSYSNSRGRFKLDATSDDDRSSISPRWTTGLHDGAIFLIIR